MEVMGTRMELKSRKIQICELFCNCSNTHRVYRALWQRGIVSHVYPLHSGASFTRCEYLIRQKIGNTTSRRNSPNRQEGGSQLRTALEIGS